MKKLFKASVFLAALGLFILASQISCKKVSAQISTTAPGSTAKILYTVNTGLPYRDSTEHIVSDDTTATVVVQLASTLQTELYYCNEDGSSPTLIPIPTNLILNNGGSARLTPDGLTVIFQASTTQNGPASIYSISLNGSNLKTIVNSSVSSYGGVILLDAN
jgi:hypothetical protein